MSQQVTKEEFEEFVAEYPRQLTWDTNAMFEPPVRTANDFSGGKEWQQSIVAHIVLNTAMQGHPCYNGEPDEYFLRQTQP